MVNPSQHERVGSETQTLLRLLRMFQDHRSTRNMLRLLSGCCRSGFQESCFEEGMRRHDGLTTNTLGNG